MSRSHTIISLVEYYGGEYGGGDYSSSLYSRSAPMRHSSYAPDYSSHGDTSKKPHKFLKGVAAGAALAGGAYLANQYGLMGGGGGVAHAATAAKATIDTIDPAARARFLNNVVGQTRI